MQVASLPFVLEVTREDGLKDEIIFTRSRLWSWNQLEDGGFLNIIQERICNYAHSFYARLGTMFSWCLAKLEGFSLLTIYEKKIYFLPHRMLPIRIYGKELQFPYFWWFSAMLMILTGCVVTLPMLFRCSKFPQGENADLDTTIC